MAYRCNACGHVQRLGEPLEKLITEAVFAVIESLDLDQPLFPPTRYAFRELYGVLAREQGLLERLEDKVARELISEAAAAASRQVV